LSNGRDVAAARIGPGGPGNDFLRRSDTYAFRMEPDTALTVLGAGVGIPVLNKLLGPAADRIGAGGWTLADTSVECVKRVFEKATRRAGPRLDDGGGVPPKVLKEVMEEAAVAEDELTQDYLAGVLASARSENGRDDRAAAHARLVGDLSAYAPRTHYLMYASAQHCSVESDADDFRTDAFSRKVFVVGGDEHIAGMSFSAGELA
jgi:hypothetical protein